MTTLTGRQLQVAELIARRTPVKVAARALGVTPSTIRAHCVTIYRQLGVHSRAELAVALAATDPAQLRKRKTNRLGLHRGAALKVTAGHMAGRPAIFLKICSGTQVRVQVGDQVRDVMAAHVRLAA